MSHTGQAPFGFEWRQDTLNIVEHEARVRRLAFELFAEFKNKATVAKRLNELGHRTRRESTWRDVTVARLLSCSSANGLYAVNKTALNDSGQRIEKPQDEWDFIPCPRLVTEELWKRVQAVLASEVSSAPPAAPGCHAFTGLLFCGCGARTNAASSSAKYVCAQCGNRIPIAGLENAFLDEVTSFLHTRLHSAAEIITGDSDLAAQRQFIQRTEEMARGIDEEIAKTERLYMDNRITVDRFEKLHRPLEDQRRTTSVNSERSKPGWRDCKRSRHLSKARPRSIRRRFENAGRRCRQKPEARSPAHSLAALSWRTTKSSSPTNSEILLKEERRHNILPGQQIPAQRVKRQATSLSTSAFPSPVSVAPGPG